MATYIILGIIVLYSVWTIYRALTKKSNGNCGSCTKCQFNDSCDEEK